MTLFKFINCSPNALCKYFILSPSLSWGLSFTLGPSIQTPSSSISSVSFNSPHLALCIYFLTFTLIVLSRPTALPKIIPYNLNLLIYFVIEFRLDILQQEVYPAGYFPFPLTKKIMPIDLTLIMSGSLVRRHLPDLPIVDIYSLPIIINNLQEAHGRTLVFSDLIHFTQG